MARIANKLTKEMLKAYGIVSVEWSEEEYRWIVLRNWWDCRSKGSDRVEETKVITELTETETFIPHKYGQDKTYKKYTFSYNNRSISIPVARLVLAWIYGEVPEGYDACHGKRGELDNKLDNIYIDTHLNNIRQRNLDYQMSIFNQYQNSKLN